MLKQILAGIALIVVPKSNEIAERLGIALSSGIVVRFYEEGLIDVYYEGNLHGSSNLRTYEDRVYHAWDRMRMKYPTSARTRVLMSEIETYFDVVGKVVKQVGHYTIEVNPKQRRIVNVWCGKPANDPGYTLDCFASGRYDVLLPNGARAGSIIGGADTWAAEVGNQTLGYGKTKEKAAEKIMVNRGLR